jgi:hypothetical protein
MVSKVLGGELESLSQIRSNGRFTSIRVVRQVPGINQQWFVPTRRMSLLSIGTTTAEGSETASKAWVESCRADATHRPKPLEFGEVHLPHEINSDVSGTVSEWFASGTAWLAGGPLLAIAWHRQHGEETKRRTSPERTHSRNREQSEDREESHVASPTPRSFGLEAILMIRPVRSGLASAKS